MMYSAVRQNVSTSYCMYALYTCGSYMTTSSCVAAFSPWRALSCHMKGLTSCCVHIKGSDNSVKNPCTPGMLCTTLSMTSILTSELQCMVSLQCHGGLVLRSLCDDIRVTFMCEALPHSQYLTPNALSVRVPPRAIPGEVKITLTCKGSHYCTSAPGKFIYKGTYGAVALKLCACVADACMYVC